MILAFCRNEESRLFLNHSKKETADEMTMSHSNAFEADMVVGLTRYLLSQGSYTTKDITIITMYTGQLLLIKNKMPKREFEGIKITSVDNFQGEENKIIIISLVRSNVADNLGFVKIENRVCVCLSRAQYGMYVFGNFDMLSRGSELWKNVVNEAKEAKELGSRLLLGCHMHQNITEIQKPEDFKNKSPTGGCRLPCKKKLNCGHICKMSCHNKDVEHKEYKCTEKCTKIFWPCNHPCPNAVMAYNVKRNAERHVCSTPEMSIKTERASGAVNTESVRGLVDCLALLCHVTTDVTNI
ncbi:hypothetical protein EB796_019959 [Bugula neritina]|uniref:DNA2/NAM7 helicase-like C-terminal domain-containing protein n=1 Tax=Bugula neritina TaxID=10212 RepID=A0A7J7J733_BUGNE|nr:hypothetical protein EB796_019959 [Bugula neritina]